VIAYFLFGGRSYAPLHDTLVLLGYFGTFLAGFFYAYAFTAAPAAAVLLILAKEQNLYLAGFIAGLGALLGDLVIFHFIRHRFSDEVQKLSGEKSFCTLRKRYLVLFENICWRPYQGFLLLPLFPLKLVLH